MPSSTAHRALGELETCGFVTPTVVADIQKTYRAVLLAHALESYALYQRVQVLSLLQKQSEVLF